MDVIRRLPLTPERRDQLGVGSRDQPFEKVRQQLADACPPAVTELLCYCGSNPRALACGLAYLSGASNPEVPGMQVSGTAGKSTGVCTTWLSFVAWGTSQRSPPPLLITLLTYSIWRGSPPCLCLCRFASDLGLVAWTHAHA
jgi:hypothetical protein